MSSSVAEPEFAQGDKVEYVGHGQLNGKEGVFKSYEEGSDLYATITIDGEDYVLSTRWMIRLDGDE